MAAGIMNTLLGKAYAADAVASVEVDAMTLVDGTKTGAAFIWVHAIGGSLYLNFGAAATSTNCVGVIAEGAPALVPALSDPRVIAKDAGADVGATWWK
jgi:hypothetical protein